MRVVEPRDFAQTQELCPHTPIQRCRTRPPIGGTDGDEVAEVICDVPGEKLLYRFFGLLDVYHVAAARLYSVGFFRDYRANRTFNLLVAARQRELRVRRLALSRQHNRVESAIGKRHTAFTAEQSVVEPDGQRFVRLARSHQRERTLAHRDYFRHGNHRQSAACRFYYRHLVYRIGHCVVVIGFKSDFQRVFGV